MILQGSTIESDELGEYVTVIIIIKRPNESKNEEFDQPFRVGKRRNHKKMHSPKEMPSKEEITAPQKKKKIILKA